jgi:hypothetical protein
LNLAQRTRKKGFLPCKVCDYVYSLTLPTI